MCEKKDCKKLFQVLPPSFGKEQPKEEVLTCIMNKNCPRYVFLPKETEKEN